MVIKILCIEIDLKHYNHINLIIIWNKIPSGLKSNGPTYLHPLHTHPTTDADVHGLGIYYPT